MNRTGSPEGPFLEGVGAMHDRIGDASDGFVLWHEKTLSGGTRTRFHGTLRDS